MKQTSPEIGHQNGKNEQKTQKMQAEAQEKAAAQEIGHKNRKNRHKTRKMLPGAQVNHIFTWQFKKLPD